MEVATEDCCVKVAVHIRPLIGDERLQGCKDCISVVPGKPQIHIGAHSFTFDDVYGSTGAPSSALFEERVAPLVDGLFQGYNATVIAYGQTGSGKTYTMGTSFRDGCKTAVIPQVMNALFNKVERLKHQSELQLHVSFIEILNEEVKDLLDTTNSDTASGHVGKVPVLGKPPIQIRETSNGVITLAGSTEIAVSTLKEMVACLEQGSLSRATGSTNMNNQSSRSHAIFTITLEQIRKIHSVCSGHYSPNEDMGEELLSAKLHLVDLAGSERAKRTGCDGLRFKEGIHINKGLLALGNVISALGDEKKRKEVVHIPYRDSKLTRLLQVGQLIPGSTNREIFFCEAVHVIIKMKFRFSADVYFASSNQSYSWQDSLGGNSKTFMIACISPADINAEETLNTLKYANRARNIQNKLIVNRDLVSNEIQNMRRQIDYLQAELSALGSGVSPDEKQVLKKKISFLETTNEELRRKLYEYHSRHATGERFEAYAHEVHNGLVKVDECTRNFQSHDSSDYSFGEGITAESSKEINGASSKELEHTLLRNCMDRELNELNKRLEEKEFEMRHCGGFDTEVLKQHFGKKIIELEEEKRIVEQERDRLLAEVESLSYDGQTQKMRVIHAQRLKELEAQILELKKKQENHVKLMKQKQKIDEAIKRLQDEIHVIKAQKVQLQHKIKQEADHFRQWKSSREKELLHLKKEGRKNEYERHKLQALNQRQKMVLRRKTEEAANATKRLKELLEARKSSSRENLVYFNQRHPPTTQKYYKSFQRWLDHELEVMVKMHEARIEYERKSQVQVALAEELAILKKADEPSLTDHTPPREQRGYSRLSSISPNARIGRIASLENMLSVSSNTLVAMASQLSEAEARECSFSGRGHWNHLRSMGDAKNLLQRMFTAATDARCQLWEKEMEIKEMKTKLMELLTLLEKSEAQRNEILKEHKREQAVNLTSATSFVGGAQDSVKDFSQDTSCPLSSTTRPAQKQLKFTAGIVNGVLTDSAAFLGQTRKMVPVAQLSMKRLAVTGQGGKLWRWKRSHHKWLLQFKWRWQKPWRLSEMIKKSEKRSRSQLYDEVELRDETIVRLKPQLHDIVDLISIDPDLQL